jgi:tellurite resistance protein TerC
MKHDKHGWYSWLMKAPNLRVAKRIVVAVIGGTVTLIGIALIVLPGPAFIVIPIGLSILATEFVWAKRWLRKARQVATPFKSKKTPHDA